ncbi:hypothetical protein BDN70DRAFT_3366 [Pholiota conissans]|uniref:Uncharacterized protein n=1 Tax=Pholiota conissans TaxID=109636 RepID=A0A9P5ZE17_9AGAR|nr:hypothetical protein BDN70DRAFT_3366 [Pholiota conissans]
MIRRYTVLNGVPRRSEGKGTWSVDGGSHLMALIAHAPESLSCKMVLLVTWGEMCLAGTANIFCAASQSPGHVVEIRSGGRRQYLNDGCCGIPILTLLVELTTRAGATER